MGTPLLLIISLLLISCSSPSTSLPPAALSQPIERAGQVASSEQWPRQVVTGSERITLYQPQAERWSDQQIEERAVVSVETPSSSLPVYGVVRLKARTITNPGDKQIRFEDVQFTQAEFPSHPDLSKPVLDALRKESADLLKPISQDRLRADLEVTQLEEKQKSPVLRNAPPRIFFSSSPALLVLIDGDPVMRETADKNLLRVINTRVLLLLDSSSGRYFLRLGDGWLEAPALKGPWKAAKNPPEALEKVLKAAAEHKEADLLDDPRSPLARELDDGRVPGVFVSTEPAELLQTRGTPEYKSIPGTRLVYVENTSDTIFVNQNDQNHYVLLSGRWYRGKSLQGPWTYVSAKNLPADFAKIPETHRKSSVLASVAGTPQARENAIKNEVPQTAKVDRENANLDVRYDGDPQFKPVEDTSLRYAANSAVPVIQVSRDTYYALRAGVWFTASDPHGPWAVATSVPSAIYTIPPSSPLYYVTFVRIYDSTPRYVYVGYTPGYLGSYYCSDGVVVFGTGYSYPPWVGTVWIGTPWTFGFGWTSWGWGYYPWWTPWWGPWWAGVPVYYGPYPPASSAPSSTTPNVYQGWSMPTVTTTNPNLFNTPYVPGNTQARTNAGASTWQATPPDQAPPPSSAWNPPSSGETGSAPSWSGPSSNNEQAKIQGYTGESPSSGGSWAPAAPAPAAPAAPPPAAAAAPPPPPPPPAPAAPSGGHAGATGQAFPGGGWGPKR